MKTLFVTGMMRSGTTLLQRILNTHPDMLVSYQSKTACLLNKIKSFHDEKGISKYHLLSHYSPNTDYTFLELQCWLRDNMSVEEILPSNGSLYTGVKEVLAEEFLPFFVNEKVKCINIIRDPRDVIASMSFGNGFKYTGIERPILFDIKNWRKSVLISHLLKDSPYLLTIRMEDLLIEPQKTMLVIYNFLDVEELPHSVLVEKMSDKAWKGNSSFGDKKVFDKSVIENFKNILSISTVQYIEATCDKEMDCMGYEKSYLPMLPDYISEYVEPFEIRRVEFVNNYSSSVKNMAYELARYYLSFDDVLQLEFNRQ
jgi:hypothetical protein